MTIAAVGQEEHLIFKGVRVEAIRVIKDNGLPFPPIFKIEFRAVFGFDGAHSPRVGWCCGSSNRSLLRWFIELGIAANIGPLPTARLAMTAASAILSTVAYLTGSVTESSKAETVGPLSGEDPRGK
jgi:hypothetical protein